MCQQYIEVAVVKGESVVKVECGTVIDVVYAHDVEPAASDLNGVLLIGKHLGACLFKLRDVPVVVVMLTCDAVERITCGGQHLCKVNGLLYELPFALSGVHIAEEEHCIGVLLVHSVKNCLVLYAVLCGMKVADDRQPYGAFHLAAGDLRVIYPEGEVIEPPHK